jgi:hypothetical protein
VTDKAEEIVQLMQEFSELFDKLCQERHKAGSEEYGAFTFLENDVVRMMAEELADVANYARMHFIKLMMLQGLLQEDVLDKLDTDADDNITIGLKAFRGVGETGWQKS